MTGGRRRRYSVHDERNMQWRMAVWVICLAYDESIWSLVVQDFIFPNVHVWSLLLPSCLQLGLITCGMHYISGLYVIYLNCALMSSIGWGRGRGGKTDIVFRTLATYLTLFLPHVKFILSQIMQQYSD